MTMDILTSIDPAELARCLFDESNDALVIFEPETLQLLDVNPHAQRLTRRTRRELLECRVPDLVGTDDSALLEDFLESCHVTRLFHSRETYQLFRRNKTPLDVNITVSRLHTSPATLGLIAVRNISDRKALEAELRQARSKLQSAFDKQTQQFVATTGELHDSERRLSELVNDIDAIVWESDVPGDSFTFVSAPAESILGYPSQQWIEQSDFRSTHIHPEEAADAIAELREVVSCGEDREMEFRMKAASGEYRWMRDVVRVVKDSNNVPIKLRGIMTDITEHVCAERERVQLDEELRKRERELAHVARLSTMGEMVAGIAHELNQPLAAISNFANAAVQTVSHTPHNIEAPIQTWMEQAAEQAVRCGDIIRRLRGFTRKDDSQRKAVSVRNLIQDTTAMLNDLIAEHHITLDLSVPESDVFVFGNETQLQQVLVNLLRNAGEATTLSRTASPLIRIEASDGRDRVRITVQDNGPGIPPETASRLFEAFFTTRDAGMGMGLAISRSIVTSHHGDLTFEPTRTGAKFVIELPSSRLP